MRHYIKPIARTIIRICDWGNGYQGKILTDSIQALCLVVPTIALFMAMFILFM